MLTAAIHTSERTFESGALDKHSFFRPKAMFMDDLLHAFKPARHCQMVEWLIKLLTYLIGAKFSIVHLWFIVLSMSPAFVWVFWHLSCWQCIVKHGETCDRAVRFLFKYVNCLVNLLQQVLCSEISITIFSSLENNMCLAAIKVSISLMPWIWEFKTLTHYHLIDGPILKFGIWKSSEKGLLPFDLVHVDHFCGSRSSCSGCWRKMLTCHVLWG